MGFSAAGGSGTIAVRFAFAVPWEDSMKSSLERCGSRKGVSVYERVHGLGRRERDRPEGRNVTSMRFDLQRPAAE